MAVSPTLFYCGNLEGVKRICRNFAARFSAVTRKVCAGEIRLGENGEGQGGRIGSGVLQGRAGWRSFHQKCPDSGRTEKP